MDDRLAAWERAASPLEARPGVPTHVRQGLTAAPEAPAARVIELTRDTGIMRGYLAEACAEIRRLERDHARWHQMRDASFAGVPMAQVWVDLYLWEAILNSNPDLQGIVEIGTWEGGLSGWLWAQTRIREIGFVTYDAVAPARSVRGFHRCDVFAEPERVREAIRGFGEPILVFCDGGNKPRELKTFAPMLTDPRSLILVHDWGTESGQADVPDWLEMVYGDLCEEIGSITRAFRTRA